MLITYCIIIIQLLSTFLARKSYVWSVAFLGFTLRAVQREFECRGELKDRNAVVMAAG